MRNIKNMKLSGLLALAMAFVMLAGTLAYFTDRIGKDASFSTISNGVNIEPDPDDPPPDPDHPENKLSAKWAAVNADALANFNPGDKLDLSYKLANVGQLAVDVRETFVITSSKPMTDGAPEFRLFLNAIQDNATKAYTGGTVVVTEEKIDTTHYKYTISSYSLSSSQETVAGAATSSDKTYQLVFDKEAGNAFQGATCTIDYLVEAKQHSDGGNADWVTAATASLTLGGQNISAVPAAPAS